MAAWNHVVCVGTNYLVRARALAHAGWYPNYCVSDDYPLSMELTSLGYTGVFISEPVAFGQAPESVRTACRQQSRWQKGHFQVRVQGAQPPAPVCVCEARAAWVALQRRRRFAARGAQRSARTDGAEPNPTPGPPLPLPTTSRSFSASTTLFSSEASAGSASGSTSATPGAP